jgi:hypothetical protein
MNMNTNNSNFRTPKFIPTREWRPNVKWHACFSTKRLYETQRFTSRWYKHIQMTCFSNRTSVMPSSTATVPKLTKGIGRHYMLTCSTCGAEGEYYSSLAAMNSHSLWCAAAWKKAEANTKKAAAAAHRKPHRGLSIRLFDVGFFSTRVLYNWTDRVSLYSCSN